MNALAAMIMAAFCGFFLAQGLWSLLGAILHAAGLLLLRLREGREIRAWRRTLETYEHINSHQDRP